MLAPPIISAMDIDEIEERLNYADILELAQKWRSLTINWDFRYEFQ